MAVDDAKRLELSNALGELLGPDLASVLMDNLPPFNWSQLATTADLERLSIELRGEMGSLRRELGAELRGEMEGLRGEHVALRGELTGEINALRGEISALRGEMTSEISGLRGDISDRLTAQTRWMAGSLIATVTLLVGASQVGALL